MINALTVDVEDYFHVTAFEDRIARGGWDRYPLRVVNNTMKILDLFEEYSIQATFFVLGWVAEKAPGLVREIQQRKHQVACHGTGHQLIFRIGPARFRDDIRHARDVLENITGRAVTGYRAPSYSITRESLWALEILVEEGFTYDSSIFPIHHDTYGIPDAKRFPHTIETPSGTIREYPLSTYPVRFGGKEIRLPIAGGGYLRFFPVSWIRKAIEYINVTEKQPAIIYFHPWEIDPWQPRIKASLKAELRHYTNLHKMEGKVRYLLDRCRFSCLTDTGKGSC